MTRRATLVTPVPIVVAFLLAGPILTAALAQQQRPASAPIQVHDAWARATPPGAAAGAIYMTLTSPAGDKLTGASSPAAQTAEVHEMRMDGAIMRMRPVEGGLDLPPGVAVALRPGGYHLMLQGLRAPLRQGQTVPVRLTFQNAPPLEIKAAVMPIGASGPGPAAAEEGRAGQAAMPGMSMGR